MITREEFHKAIYGMSTMRVALIASEMYNRQLEDDEDPYWVEPFYFDPAMGAFAVWDNDACKTSYRSAKSMQNEFYNEGWVDKMYDDMYKNGEDSFCYFPLFMKQIRTNESERVRQVFELLPIHEQAKIACEVFNYDYRFGDEWMADYYVFDAQTQHYFFYDHEEGECVDEVDDAQMVHNFRASEAIDNMVSDVENFGLSTYPTLKEYYDLFTLYLNFQE